jgi:hypothetical protein
MPFVPVSAARLLFAQPGLSVGLSHACAQATREDDGFVHACPDFFSKQPYEINRGGAAHPSARSES